MAASLLTDNADNGPSSKAGSTLSAGATPAQPALRASALWLAVEEDLRTAGIRAIEPPRESKQAIRGNLYLVAEVRGDGADLRELSERILSLLQRTYYTARGGQAQVLAEAARSAQALLLAHNDKQRETPARLNMAIAALLGSRLLLACEGGSFAILRSGSRVELYPKQPGVERRPHQGDTADTLELTPAKAADAVEVLRWDMQPGDALLLAAPAWAERLEMRTLAATVLYVDTDVAWDAAQELRAQAGATPPPGLLLIFDDAGAPNVQTSATALPAGLTLTPTPPTAGDAGSSAPLRTNNPLVAPVRRSPGALPTAVAAPPPVLGPTHLPPPEPLPPFPAAAGQSPALAESDEAPLDIPTFPMPQVGRAQESTPPAGAQSPSPGAWAPVRPASPTTEGPDAASPGNQPPGSGHTVSSTVVAAGAAVGAAAHTGMERARGVLRNMLPEQRPATPADFVATEDDAADWAAAPGAYVEGGRVADTGAPLRAPPFQPPPPSTGGRARLFILLALLLALIVPVIIGGLYWRLEYDNRGRADSLIILARARVIDAQAALDSGDTRTALNFLSEAEDYTENTIELVGTSAPVNQLLSDIRTMSDDASNVQKLYQLTTPIISFPSGSSPTRLIVQDQEIYVLDPGRAVVERYRLDPSLERVPDGVGVPVLRTGDQVGGASVGQMVDIAWLPPVPGYDDKATLLVLDGENQLFSYDPRVEGPNALTLVGSESFGPLRQVETYLGRVYLADAGEGQMWRYGAGQYDLEPPSPWFNEPLQLEELVSLRIDGDVWLLMRNGQVLRYRDRAQLPFSLDPNVGLVREAVDLFVGDGTNPYLYLADGGSGRIWVFDKEGVYQKQLAAPEGDPLRGLSSIFIEDVTDSLFLLTASALYKHPLPRN